MRWHKIKVALILVLAVSCGAHAVDQKSRFDTWTETPLNADGVERITRFLEDNGSSSFLMIYKGKIAYRYGDIHRKHLIHSMRKPLLSLLYGEAVASGKIDLLDEIDTLGLEEKNTPFLPSEKAATVAQLLESRSGIYMPAAAETSEMAARRPKRGSDKAGERYFYNNWSFNSAGTLFETKTGESIYDAFDRVFAKPLGMSSYQGKIGDFSITGSNDQDLPLKGLDGFYLLEADKSRHKAYHFRLSAHDLALVGQLVANGGAWQGKQLIAKDWIERSTRCATVLNANIGGGRSLCYGMMWEVVQQDGKSAAFTHTGLGVHMIYVHPGAGLVLVHRVATESDGYRFPRGRVSALIGLSFAALR